MYVCSKMGIKGKTKNSVTGNKTQWPRLELPVLWPLSYVWLSSKQDPWYETNDRPVTTILHNPLYIYMYTHMFYYWVVHWRKKRHWDPAWKLYNVYGYIPSVLSSNTRAPVYDCRIFLLTLFIFISIFFSNLYYLAFNVWKSYRELTRKLLLMFYKPITNKHPPSCYCSLLRRCRQACGWLVKHLLTWRKMTFRFNVIYSPCY